MALPAGTRILIFLTSTRDAMRDSSASQTDRSAQRSRAAFPTTPPHGLKGYCIKKKEQTKSCKSAEEQWSQWTAGELWGVECETQSLRHRGAAIRQGETCHAG